MHYTNIPPLARNSFCYCPFFLFFFFFFLLAAAAFHLKLVTGGVWGLVCQLVMWLSGMGDCLNPMPWAPADQMLNGLAKMIGKCCASLRSHSESSEAAKKSISQHKYQGPFHFQPNRLLYSDTSCQSRRRVEQRISIQTRKMDFPEHNCPCSCHIILLYLITELPMNFSWDRGIKHLSS